MENLEAAHKAWARVAGRRKLKGKPWIGGDLKGRTDLNVHLGQSLKDLKWKWAKIRLMHLEGKTDNHMERGKLRWRATVGTKDKIS